MRIYNSGSRYIRVYIRHLIHDILGSNPPIGEIRKHNDDYYIGGYIVNRCNDIPSVLDYSNQCACRLWLGCLFRTGRINLGNFFTR